MRAPVEFASVLGSLIARYLDLKRALGRRADSLQYVLAQFDRFLAFYNAKDLNQETFTAWCCSIAHVATNTRRQRMRIVYHLCLFRRRYEPSCFVPDPSQFPPLQPWPLPPIFSEGEITRLLLATGPRPALYLRRTRPTALVPRRGRRPGSASRAIHLYGT